MISKARTFIDLPARHKGIFLRIFLLTPVVEIGVRVLKLKRTIRFLNFFLDQKKEAPENTLNLVGTYTVYSNLYQKQFFSFGNCLARSIVLWFLLARKGIKTDLRFGMKKDNKQLFAHAWLEFEGNALVSKDETEEEYVPFSESILSKIA